MTPWQQHKLDWEYCSRCTLCEGRTRTVLYRGAIPCDVLMIGEAPGQSEDVRGLPLIGPAGLELDDDSENHKGYIQQALGQVPDKMLKFGFTNIIACVPPPNDTGKIGEPPDFAIKACSPRVISIIKITKPRLLVLVGKHAQKWVPKIIRDHAPIVNRPASRPSAAGKKLRTLQRGVATDPLRYLSGKETKVISIDHPASIFKAPIASKGLIVQRIIVTLADAFAEL